MTRCYSSRAIWSAASFAEMTSCSSQSTRYLSAEQRMGRASKTADPEAVATVLVGGCFQVAFLETHWGQKTTQAEARRKIESIVDTLLTGFAPAG
jgi:hypothetical protein